MKQKIYLAYDGSINADWVSRYAIHMASNAPEKKCTLLHILDGITPEKKILSGIDIIEHECRVHRVEFEKKILPMSQNVLRTLVQAIPEGEGSYCICGARITSRGKGFLAGTISEKLLRCKKFNVLAIRVVNPGLLGSPRKLLFPLAGHPRGFKAAMPFLMMLAPRIQKLHILRIIHMNPFRFRYISTAKARTASNEGKAYVKKVLEEIERRTGEYDLDMDGDVVLAVNWAKEILVHANKVRAGMILLGATDRTLPSRFFYGNKIEQILKKTPCDVGMYRKI